MASAGDVNGDGTDDLIVGSRDWSSPTTPNLGRAYLFFGECGGTLAASPSWIAEGVPIEGWGSALGADVGAAGDVNGDGFGDIFVLERDWWAPGSLACDPADLTPCASGRVSVWYGGPTGPAADAAGRALAPDWSWAPSSWDEWIDAVTAGDVNGNAIGDLVVAVPDFGADHVRIFLGVAVAGLPPNSNQTLEDPDNQLQSEFGQTMALGDVDGDGKDDLLVGAFGAWNSGTSADHAGVAYLFSGTASGVTPTPVWTRWGTANYEKYGGAVAIPGDMDGDGYADMVISAPASYEYWHPSPLIDPRVEFFRGGDYGPEDEPDSTLVEESWHLAPAGDVDGSAALGLVPRADLAMERRPRGPDGFAIGQEALVVHGSTSLVGDITLVRDVVVGAEPVAGLGDVNADGFDDVAVGDAWYFEPPAGETTGRAWLHPGQSSAFGAAPPEPARFCQHPTEEEVSALRVLGVKFVGAGFVEVLQDTGQPYPPVDEYATLHWFDHGFNGLDTEGPVDPDDDGPLPIQPRDRRAPVAYVRGSTMAVEAIFRFKPWVEPVTVDDGCVQIQGLGSDGAIFTGVASQHSDGSIRGTFTSDTALASRIAFLSEYGITWMVTRDGSSWNEAGFARTRVYVLLAEPDLPPALRYETVFDVACRAGKGCADVACMVNAVYDEFRSPDDGVRRKSVDGLNVTDGVPMQYWPEERSDLDVEMEANAFGPGQVNHLPGMLDPNPERSLNGRGACGAWQELFMACLRLHGVPKGSAPPGLIGLVVEPAHEHSGLIVRKHKFSSTPAGPVCTLPVRSDAPAAVTFLPLTLTHVASLCPSGVPEDGKSCDEDGVPAQRADGASNPHSTFQNHIVVSYEGHFYDPSYGTDPVPDPTATVAAYQEWEHGLLAGCLAKCPGDPFQSTVEDHDSSTETFLRLAP